MKGDKLEDVRVVMLQNARKIGGMMSEVAGKLEDVRVVMLQNARKIGGVMS